MHGPNRLATAATREQLSPVKRALLQQLRKRPIAAAAPALIPRRTSAGPAPLSFAQQRLWFLDQLEPGNPFYNVAIAARILGPLDAQTLAAALSAVVDRHAALRTTFHDVAGTPEQRVHPQIDIVLARHDLSGSAPDARDAQLADLARVEALRPFDLARGPLLRATLVRLGDDNHTLLLTLHHIVCDGWSIAVLQNELALAYEAIRNGRSAELPELPLEYSDFAVWQRAEAQGAKFAEQSRYWQAELAELPGPLELPLDRPRPAVQGYSGDVCRMRIAGELLKRLLALATSENATLAMLLLSAYQVVLARFSGSRDLCVGMPIAGRNRAELEGLVGFFVNTLPIRCRLEDNPSFRELLGRQQSRLLSAYAHQDLPFERLVDELQLARDLSRNPLVQTMFVMQNVPLARREIGGLTLSAATFDHAPVANYELTLNINEHADRLDISLIYNTDLFEAATAARVLDAYQRLLAAIVADPDERALELPLLSLAQRKALVQYGTGTATALPTEKSVHELFVAQARRTPSANAICAGPDEWTYAELDRWSNCLARYLIDQGAATGEPIGVCLGRSPQMIATLLAILKAGAAYVPLDPHYPAARRAYMVRDAGLKLIVTDSETASCLPAGDYKSVLLDQADLQIADCDGTELAPRADGDSLAYVIYTSGSTGEPKGVEVPHRGLVNHACCLARRCQLAVGDRLLQYLSLSFDAAAEEILPTLASGATLVLHPSPAELSGRVLLDWSREHGVNILHLPVAVWSSLVDALDVSRPAESAHLKVVIAGGDSVPAEKLARWCAVTCARFLFAYGVTEASITSTMLDSADELPATSSQCLPIGRPIDNTRLYVVDELGQLVPAGVPGELWIGGIGIARGYLGRPQLTASRFVVDTFCPAPDSRLYRTGDRVRWLADGNLEFLGRIDRQVKIRGYRIEPAEIEAVLQLHASVREAVVVASGSGDARRLAAYVGCVPGANTSETELREFVAERLPPHMMPAAMMVLAQLPRLSCSKVDVAALPPPIWKRSEGSTEFVAPRSEPERILATIWAEILGLDRVGLTENFFDLGGDSIRSIQVVARAAAAGWRITPKQLFQNQTIAELARVTELCAATRVPQEPVVGPIALLPIQHEFFALATVDPHHHNQAMLLEVAPSVTPEHIEAAAGALVNHHDALRARFVPSSSGEWQQEVALPEDRRWLDLHDLSNATDQQLAVEIERAAAVVQASFDLARSPLFRFVYFDLGPRRAARLLIVVHHLVIDAVSWRILLADLDSLCRQLSNDRSGGGKPDLPPRTTSVSDWAERLIELVHSTDTLAEAPAWANAEHAIEQLPRDRHGGPNIVATAASVVRTIPADLTARLFGEAASYQRARPQEMLVAALAEVLAGYCGTNSARMNLEGHGRADLSGGIDLSRTVGWFTSLYPVVIPAPVRRSTIQWLRQAKQTLRAVHDGGVHYGALRWLSRDNAVRATLAAAAADDVCFNYLGQFDYTLPSGALFAPADEPIGPMVSPRAQRRHLWEIVAFVRAGALVIQWTYSEAHHRPETIARLADLYAAALERLADANGADCTIAVTPADFPLAELDQQGLDHLAKLVERDRHLSQSGAMTNVADVWPLAPLQELMLAHALAGGDPDVMVEQFTGTFIGALDVEAFRHAWDLVAARHAMLRTTPAWEGLKRPVQIVRKSVELPWKLFDWRALDAQQQSAHLAAVEVDCRQQSLNLAHAPLMRFALVRLADDIWKFVWTCHHFVLDGWSVGIVLSEVFANYASLVEKRPLMSAPGGALSDYLQWIESQKLADALNYWRTQLMGGTSAAGRPLVELRAARPGVQPTFAERELRLTAHEACTLKHAAADYRVGLGALVSAAWATLLARYAEQPDVTFGVAVSGRPPQVPDIESIVGSLANNVPLRVRAEPAVAISRLCQAIAELQAGAQPYEYLSPQQIATATGSDSARLFDTLVVVENYPHHATDGWRAGNIEVRDAHGTTTAVFPLTLVALPGEEFVLRLIYDETLYSAETASRILEQTTILLRAIAQNPAARLCELSLAGEATTTANGGAVVLDCAGQRAPVGMAGELWIAVGLDGSAPTSAGLKTNQEARDGHPQLRRTGYRAMQQSDGTLEFLGPAPHPNRQGVDRPLVKVGQHTVDPAEIAAVLLLHPAVKQAAVFGFAAPDRTHQLAAYIVALPQAQLGIEGTQHGLLLNELRQFASARLPAHMIPAAWRVVDSRPLDAEGRFDTASLPRPLRARGDVAQPYVAPRTDCEARIATIWSELLGIEPIGTADDFSDLGGNSSQAVALVTRLSEEFGRRLPLAALVSQPTVAQLAELLSGEQRAAAADTLVPLGTGGRGAPLFCVHPAGGTVFCYRQLAQLLDRDVPIFGLQASGVDGIQTAHETIEAMAGDYVAALKSVQPRGPYRLCGWSTGGVIAFEMARQILATGDDVELLALLDAAIPAADAQLTEDDLAPMLALMFPGETPERFRELRDRPLAEQVEYFRQRAEGAKVLLAGAGGGAAQAVFDVFEANMRAVVAYRPAPIDARLVLVRAAEHATPLHADPLLGWGAWAAAGTEVFVVPGSHLTMLEHPAVRDVAKILNQLLAGSSHSTCARAVAVGPW